jgi:hypothetical protein
MGINMTFSEKEKHVLSSLVRLGENALALSIRDDIERRQNIHYSVHEIFEELRRLEDRGLACSCLVGSKIFFNITESGESAAFPEPLMSE